METGNKGALSPEQMAQLKNHETNVTQPQQPTMQKPTHHPPKPAAIRKPTPKNVAPNPPKVDSQEVYEAETSVEVREGENQTFYKHEDSEGGSMEVDLISFRERGAETRYLSLSILGYDPNQEQSAPQQALLTIGSKEAFESLKSFFGQLNWED